MTIFLRVGVAMTRDARFLKNSESVEAEEETSQDSLKMRAGVAMTRDVRFLIKMQE